MDDFKVWKRFFKDAGLTRSDQLTYAQVFSDDQMEVRILMMMDTVASMTFLEKLGVKLGHQARILNQFKKLHVGSVENTAVEVIKLEDDIEIEIEIEIQSDSAPPPSIPALSNHIPPEQTHFPNILAVTTTNLHSSNLALSSIIPAPSSSNSALPSRHLALSVSSPVTPTLITTEQTPTILETRSPALSLSNPTPPKCTPSRTSQQTTSSDPITVPQNIADSPHISAEKTQNAVSQATSSHPLKVPQKKAASLDSLRGTKMKATPIIIAAVHTPNDLIVAQKTATCKVCNKQLNTKSISRHYKVVHNLGQSTRRGRRLCREGRDISVKQNIDSAWESSGNRRLARTSMDKLSENVQNIDVQNSCYQSTRNSKSCKNPTIPVRKIQGEGGFGGQQTRMEGGIIFKNNKNKLVPIKLFLVDGESEVGEQIPKDENGKCILKIRSRSNLDQFCLEDVSRKINTSNKHAIFLCLECTSHHAPGDGQEKRQRSLMEFGNYLKTKKKAGVGSLHDKDKIQVGEMFFFPPCSLAMELLGRGRPPVKLCVKDNYLVLVVVWFKVTQTRALSPMASDPGPIGVRKSDRIRQKKSMISIKQAGKGERIL